MPSTHAPRLTHGLHTQQSHHPHTSHTALTHKHALLHSLSLPAPLPPFPTPLHAPPVCPTPCLHAHRMLRRRIRPSVTLPQQSQTFSTHLVSVSVESVQIECCFVAFPSLPPPTTTTRTPSTLSYHSCVLTYVTVVLVQPPPLLLTHVRPVSPLSERNHELESFSPHLSLVSILPRLGPPPFSGSVISDHLLHQL